MENDIFNSNTFFNFRKYSIEEVYYKIDKRHTEILYKECIIDI
jgi:hypothetical protein